MKIVHIYKDYYPPVLGGIETHINSLVTGMKDMVDSSVLVCNTCLKTEQQDIEGVSVVKAACLGRALSAPLSPMFPSLLKNLSADILHFHLPMPTATISYLLSPPEGKVVVTYHSDIVRQSWALAAYGPFQQRFLRKADRILVTSPNYLESSKHLQPHRDKCRVVPLGMDLSLFEPSPEVMQQSGEIRNRYGERIVLFVGKLRYYKGLTFLLKAMKKVDAKLIVIGGGPLERQLKQQVREDDLEQRVFFLGDTDRRRLPSYYYACDLFCLPSIYRSEAFGLVQIEAHACGKPVVSTNLTSGVPFVNLDGETGLIVPPQDPDALADAIENLLNDAELRTRLGSFARKRAYEEFTLEKMVTRVKNIYDELMSESEK